MESKTFSRFQVAEGVAAGLGVTLLLLTVAAAVAIFIINGMKMKRFSYFQSGDFDTEYGVSGVAKEKRDAFESRYIAATAVGVALCIVCAVPLIIAGVMNASAMVCILLVALLLVLVAAAVYCFISVNIKKNGFQQLLREGDYSPKEREYNKKIEKLGGFYWSVIVVIYLIWSFTTFRWNATWIIWPVAAIIFGGISALLKKD